MEDVGCTFTTQVLISTHLTFSSQETSKKNTICLHIHCQLMTHLHGYAVRLSWIHAAFADCFNTFNRVNQALQKPASDNRMWNTKANQCVNQVSSKIQDRHFMKVFTYGSTLSTMGEKAYYLVFILSWTNLVLFSVVCPLYSVQGCDWNKFSSYFNPWRKTNYKLKCFQVYF